MNVSEPLVIIMLTTYNLRLIVLLGLYRLLQGEHDHARYRRLFRPNCREAFFTPCMASRLASRSHGLQGILLHDLAYEKDSGVTRGYENGLPWASTND